MFKPALNPFWLQLVYDLTEAKTNKTLSKAEINRIINKKISNLNGADKRRILKQNEVAKRNREDSSNARDVPARNNTINESDTNTNGSTSISS